MYLDDGIVLVVSVLVVVVFWVLLKRTKDIKNNQKEILNFLKNKSTNNSYVVDKRFQKVDSEVKNKIDLNDSSFVKRENNKNQNMAFVVGDDIVNKNNYFEDQNVKEKNSLQVANFEKIKKDIKEEGRELQSKSEFNIGAKVVPAIGILSIVLGVGFFMKYAFDNEIISETGRVILGFVSGIAFVALGEKLRAKYRGYSNLLVGGGFALLYLAAKFGLVYELYPEIAGLGIMALITAAAVAVAYKINSRLIGYVALFGGFLTPFLAWTSAPQEIILFTYTLILLVGMLFLAWKRGWMGLIFGSAFGTVLIWATSFAEHYTNNQFAIYWAFLIIFFIIFSVAPILFYFSKKSKHEIFNIGNLLLPIISGGFFVIVSYIMFEDMVKGQWTYDPSLDGDYGGEYKNKFPIFENLKFLIGLIPAILYTLLAKFSLKKMKTEKENILENVKLSEEEKDLEILEYKKPVYIFLAIAAFAVALIPALQFSGVWITISWLLEALVLALLFHKVKLDGLLTFSLIALAAGIFRIFAFEFSPQIFALTQAKATENVSIFSPIFNERALAFLVAVVVSFAIAYFAFKNGKKIVATVVGVIGNLLALIWIWAEFFTTARAGYISNDFAKVAISLVYLLYASAMMFIGISKKYIGFRFLSMAIFAFVILKTYLTDVWSLDPIFRILAFIILGVVTLFVGYYYNKNKEKVMEFIKGDLDKIKKD